VVPEEQDIDTDHDAHERKHVDHDGYVSSHAPCLSVVGSSTKALEALRSPGGHVLTTADIALSWASLMPQGQPGRWLTRH
jgi:hypothetical protein